MKLAAYLALALDLLHSVKRWAKYKFNGKPLM
jgi:hypothetical protein